jgi:hemoglobin
MNGPPQTPYQLLGVEGIQRLVNTFHDITDSLPDAAGPRAMRAADLSPMKEQLAQ